MRRSAWIAGFCRAGFWFIAIAATTRVASAQDAAAFPLELEWHAPIACGSAEQVRAELERIAHVRPGLRLTKLAARAEVEHRGGGFAVALYTEHDGESGERKLEASDCKTLVRTVTLVLALAFGAGVEVAEVADDNASPSAAASATTPATDATAGDPSAQAQTAGAEKKKDHNADQAARAHAAAATDDDADTGDNDDRNDDAHAGAARWALLMGGGVQFALMPSAAFAASLGAELELGALSIGLRSTAWPSVTEDVTSTVRARFDGIGGQLQGCGRLPWTAMTFALCGDLRTAALRGRSDGALVDRSSTAPWYALGATAAVTWPRQNWLSLRIEAALAASLNRPRFVLENFGQVQRVAQLLPAVGALLVLTP